MILNSVKNILIETRTEVDNKLLSLSPYKRVNVSKSAEEVNMFLYGKMATTEEKRLILKSCVENHIKWALPSSEDFDFKEELLHSKDLVNLLLKKSKIFLRGELESQTESLFRFEEVLEDLVEQDLFLLVANNLGFQLPFKKIQDSSGVKAIILSYDTAFIFTNAMFAERVFSTFDIVVFEEAGLSTTSKISSGGPSPTIVLMNEKGLGILKKFEPNSTAEELDLLYSKGIEMCHSIMEINQDSVEIIYETSRLVRLILTQSELNVYPLLPIHSARLSISKQNSSVSPKLSAIASSRLGILCSHNKVEVDLTELAFLKSSAQNATMIASIINLLFQEDTEENIGLLNDTITILETSLKRGLGNI